MGRLVLVANRVPPARHLSATAFTAALTSALRDRDFIWFGWSGRLSDDGTGVRTARRNGLAVATIDFTRRDRDEYYSGYAHQTLWPLFHYRIDLTSYDRSFYTAYHRVNALFAARLQSVLRDDDTVLVQDYHLIPLGEELRRLGQATPLGFYLHVPFPAPQVLATLYNHRRLIRSLLAYDVVGFQTADDLQAFRDYVERELKGSVRAHDTITFRDHETHAAVFPFGIDVQDVQDRVKSATAREQVESVAGSLGSQSLIISADRLDFAKGLAERLHAFDALLESTPALRGRVTLMQAVIASRRQGAGDEQEQLLRQLETTAGHVEGRYADVDWEPLRYSYQELSRESMIGFLRAGRVGLMTPLRDGMHIMAKEYVAAQDPDDPGVLVLSRFAGAARSLVGALVVNPYDTLETAHALRTALAMGLDERKARWSTMMAAVRRDTARSWLDGLQAALSTVA